MRFYNDKTPVSCMELLQSMEETFVQAKAELKRRRDARKSKNSAHGIDDGIEKGSISN